MSAADQSPDRIAVVGLAIRVAGAADVEEYWDALLAGRETAVELTDAELEQAGEDPAALRDERYVRRSALLDEYDCFDAGFFGLSTREARHLNPQHRIFLECCWHAIEDAMLADGGAGQRVGVFAGGGLNEYLWRHVLEDDGVDPLQARLANDRDSLTSLVSYKLGLTGPSVAVQSACSTSLVATHYACQSLLGYESDIALAGGATVVLPQGVGYLWREGGTLSADGHCRPFDAAASGMFEGSGAGVVVLKRLEDAVRDGDSIRAVIRGSAVNNDGSWKTGYTAPSVDGQAEVIAEALMSAGVGPDAIGYVEAHGTGTPVGDPIEVEALARVFSGRPPRSCALGSVKANIGHLDAAAGAAGLIKAVLSLERGVIPPHPNLTAPNPLIDIDSTPFYVNSDPAEWPEGRRLAGVSSFGMGGTNAHVVLEQAETSPLRAVPDSGEPQIVCVSAPEEAGVLRAGAAFADALDRPDGLSLAALAHGSQAGRRHWQRRRAVVGRSAAAVAAELRAISPSSVRAADVGEIVFMFPGQGAQRPGMAAALHAQSPRFRDALERCCDALPPGVREEIREALLPEGEAPAVDRTEVAQPALFAFGYALADLLAGWGIAAERMIGHSVGELVAATIAGVFTLEDAVGLVAERGRLMGACEPGAMLAVAASREVVDEAVAESDEGGVAALTAPSQTVLSGIPAYIEAAELALGERGLRCKRLRTSGAFHSPLMEPAAEAFTAAVAEVELSAPSAVVYSNVTGAPLAAEEAMRPSYWGDQLRQPVRLQDAFSAALQGPAAVFAELGPGRTLSGLLRQQRDGSSVPILAASDDAGVDLESVLGIAAGAWEHGLELDWSRFHDLGPWRAERLPEYPFARSRHWVEPAARTPSGNVEKEATVEKGQAEDPEAEAPRDGLAAEIGKVFADAFGVADVGPDDDFFALGGNSLVAIDVIDRVGRLAGTDISLRMLYDAPRPQALAEAIEREKGAESEAVEALAAELEGLSPEEIEELISGDGRSPAQ